MVRFPGLCRRWEVSKHCLCVKARLGHQWSTRKLNDIYRPFVNNSSIGSLLNLGKDVQLILMSAMSIPMSNYTFIILFWVLLLAYLFIYNELETMIRLFCIFHLIIYNKYSWRTVCGFFFYNFFFNLPARWLDLKLILWTPNIIQA